MALVIGVVLLVRFHQCISESFKCGVYLVPHDDEEVAQEDLVEDEKKAAISEAKF